MTKFFSQFVWKDANQSAGRQNFGSNFVGTSFTRVGSCLRKSSLSWVSFGCGSCLHGFRPVFPNCGDNSLFLNCFLTILKLESLYLHSAGAVHLIDVLFSIYYKTVVFCDRKYFRDFSIYHYKKVINNNFVAYCLAVFASLVINTEIVLWEFV